MKTAIAFEVDTDGLERHSDEYLSQLWHIAQANPAPFGDASASAFSEYAGREIIRRWLDGQHPALWSHQARHVASGQPTGRA